MELTEGRVKAKILPLFLLLVIFGFLVSVVESADTTKFKISSPAFEDNGTIPKKYGCAGENVNPALKFEGVPPGTKSLVLVFDDIDAPGGSYVHWILWKIDSGTREIRENSVPEGAVQGTNDFKKQNYGGPCPPTRPHRYLFKLYALDTVLNLQPASAKPDLEKAMAGRILTQAELKGTYKKK
jgi:Raf kinase inhibitor-like YbhB/YbcL family protein